MNKLITLFVALLCVPSIFAYDCKIQGVYYDVNVTYRTATVTYKEMNEPSYSGSVVIPTTITYNKQPYFVTSIGDDAFCACKGLISITIPRSVTFIGNNAFNSCYGLNRTNYTGTIADWCNITFYGVNANPIHYSHNLFIRGKEIKDLVIPSSVTSIGNWAFSICRSLTSITIPKSVTSIGRGAFIGCDNLASISVAKDNPNYNSRENCNAIIETKSNQLIAGCKNTIILNSVTSIGDGAFYGCKGLISITIPNTITSIGDDAFCNCDGLRSITIPNSVTSIGDGVFSYCDSLTSITIPNSVASIGRWAFYNCKGLTSIAIPNSVTSIGWAAFSYCRALTSITIPNSVTSIGRFAFYECDGLTSITIPNSVTSIEEDVFDRCDQLTDLYVPRHLNISNIGINKKKTKIHYLPKTRLL